MEQLGIGVTVLGMVVTVIIFGNSYNNRVKNSLPGLIIILIGICILAESYMEALIPLGALLLYAVTARKKTKGANAKIIGGTNLDRFFVECVLAEVNDFSKPKNVQKAQLLAEKYRLKYPKGIDALYQQGLKAHEEVSQQFVLNRLEVKRAEERQEFDRLNKYADLTGRDKRIAMLCDRAGELSREAKTQENAANLGMRFGQQKERDWAIWGGAASGLAGFGAGVSTAVDIQMQNMQIRAENEKRRQAALPVYMSLTGSARDNRKHAEAILKEAADVRQKLVSDNKAENLMNLITFTNTDVLVSETGAAMVCTLASAKPNFKIFGDVPAVIDGTIIAKIYEGNRLCGTAQLVLPIYGLGQKIPLNGICIDCCQPGKQYHVKFTAQNLWAMEA